jgi:hypothetical protein
MTRRCMWCLGVSFWCLLIMTGGGLSPLFAATCTVPGSHSTIQKAVNDSSCTTVNLASQTYGESVNIPRSLTIAGPSNGSAIIEGQVWVTGQNTQVQLVDLRVQNGCQLEALTVVKGAQMEGTNLRTISSGILPCPPLFVFSDDFESGNLTAWSSSVP